MLDLVARTLEADGHTVVTAGGGDEALALLDATDFDILLTDLKMPSVGGLDLLRAVRARRMGQPVILMTAFGTIETAVEAIREGAYTYIRKPFDVDALSSVVGECADQVRYLRAQSLAADDADRPTPFPIVFRDPKSRALLELVHNVAESNATVLIEGESGAGKELIARELHWRSLRRDQPFVALDANAIPENLIEAELFGAARGAYTGAVRERTGIIEQADGGTLFLDEIGNLGLSVQSKLLRFLQERRFRRIGDVVERCVDVRLITATNRNLRALVEERTFREDLFYRLTVVHVVVPSLRDRRDDIVPLAYHFLRRFDRDLQINGFRPEVIDLLIDHDWPGNVRQLENAIEHAVVMRRRGLIGLGDLPDWLVVGESNGVPGPRSLEATEKVQILKVLDACSGNRSRAARILGINRRTLIRKLKEYHVDVSEDGAD